MRGRVRELAEAAGLREEFESLQQLRHGFGIESPWDLSQLVPRVKVDVLGIVRDSEANLADGLERLRALIDDAPPRDRELLSLMFNLDRAYGPTAWMQRTEAFALDCDWCSSGRSVRHHCDVALLDLLERALNRVSGLHRYRHALGSTPADLAPTARATSDRWWDDLATSLVTAERVDLVGVAPLPLLAALQRVWPASGAETPHVRYLTRSQQNIYGAASSVDGHRSWQTWNAAVTGLRNLVKLTADSTVDALHHFASASDVPTNNCLVRVTTKAGVRTTYLLSRVVRVRHTEFLFALSRLSDSDRLLTDTIEAAFARSSPLVIREVGCTLPSEPQRLADDSLLPLEIADLVPYGAPRHEAVVKPVALAVLRHEGRRGRSVLLRLRSRLTDNDDFDKLSLLSARILEEDLSLALSDAAPRLDLSPSAALDHLWEAKGTPRPFLLPRQAFVLAAQREVHGATHLDLHADRFREVGIHVLQRDDSPVSLAFVVLTVDLTPTEVRSALEFNSDWIRDVPVSDLYISDLPLNRFLTQRRDWLLERCL